MGTRPEAPLAHGCAKSVLWLRCLGRASERWGPSSRLAARFSQRRRTEALAKLGGGSLGKSSGVRRRLSGRMRPSPRT